MNWFLDLCKGKMLTDRDLLMLAQFLGVLNYFSAVYLLMWLRRHYGDKKHYHPILETVMHVYLYFVYLLEIFCPHIQIEVIICIYVLFFIIVFSYHVSICRRFQDGRSSAVTTCLPLESFDEKTALKSSWKQCVAIVGVLWLLWTFVCIALASNARDLLAQPKYFNLVLKVSFVSLTVEGYLYVGYKQQQDHLLLGLSCPSIPNAIRLTYSVLSFAGMLVLAFYPSVIGHLSITKNLSKHLVAMVAMLLMQLLFVLDSLLYVIDWYIKNNRKKIKDGVQNNSFVQISAL